MAPAREDLSSVIASCRACRDLCDRHLSTLAGDEEAGPAFRDTVTCVAVVTLIPDRLENRPPCPDRLLEFAGEIAERLPEGDDSSCARACRTAAESIGDLIAADYDHASAG